MVEEKRGGLGGGGGRRGGGAAVGMPAFCSGEGEVDRAGLNSTGLCCSAYKYIISFFFLFERKLTNIYFSSSVSLLIIKINRKN